MRTEMVALTDFSYESVRVRVLGTQYEPWFVAADVFRVLGISLNYMARSLDRLDNDEKLVVDLMGEGVRASQVQSAEPTIKGASSPIKLMGETEIIQGSHNTVWAISEPGLYKIMLRSRTPKAEAFTRFVTHEVLPSIRKRGYYKATNRGRPLLSESNGVTKETLISNAAALGMRVTDATRMSRSELVKFCEERSDPEWIEANYDNYPYSYSRLNAEVDGLLGVILLYVKNLEKYAMCTGTSAGREDMRFTQEFKDNLPVFAKKADIEIQQQKARVV